MTGSEELKHLLDLAAGPGPGAADVTADLERARGAARARARRRFRAASAAFALVVVGGVAAAHVVSTDGTAPRGSVDAIGGSDAGRAGVRLVAARFDATPYTFDLTPRGWSVQSQNADRVTIIPDDGSVTTSGDVFVGKLVILFDENPPDGTAVVVAGRTFWIGGNSGYMTIATRSLPGEPVGVVRVQYPDDTGWTRATMLAFLGSVHVGPGARPGVG